MKQYFIKTVILLVSYFVILGTVMANAAPVSDTIPYYGEEFYQDLRNGTSNDALIERIKTVLKSFHTPGADLDQVSPKCNGPKCYSHVSVGYNNARVFLLGKFYFIQDEQGNGIKDVYCDRYVRSSDFKGGNGPSPGKVPDDKVINVEHTWPQSRFTGRYPKDLQKADLHHLFPTDSQMNSVRGNYWFGEVVKDSKELKCHTVRFGQPSYKGPDVFEPPTNHRGNVARALFYFALRYDMMIDENEEATLRKWNNDDPVDEEELARNEEIYKLQGNRNPFVDYPELTEKISNF